MVENHRKLSLFITIIALAIQKPAEATGIRHVLDWKVVPGMSLPYQTWSSFQPFTVGDNIAFVFPPGLDNVAEVTRQGYYTCDHMTQLLQIQGASPAVFNLETVGEHYFISAVPGNCLSGEKVLVTVLRPPELPPKFPFSPFSASLRKDDKPITHIVGDKYGWAPPPTAASDYSQWTSKRTFLAGDKLVFNFVNELQDVALVTKAAYEKCDTAKNTIDVLTKSPATVTLNATGDYYFTSTNPAICKFGQKLAVTVKSPRLPPN